LVSFIFHKNKTKQVDILDIFQPQGLEITEVYGNSLAVIE